MYHGSLFVYGRIRAKLWWDCIGSGEGVQAEGLIAKKQTRLIGSLDPVGLYLPCPTAGLESVLRPLP